MAAPWEKYRSQTPQESAPSGPWSKYRQPEEAPTPTVPVTPDQNRAGINTVAQGQGFSDGGVPVGGNSNVAPPAPPERPAGPLAKPTDDMWGSYGTDYDRAKTDYEAYVNYVDQNPGNGNYLDPLTGDVIYEGQRVPYPTQTTSLTGQDMIGVGALQGGIDTARGIGREALAAPFMVRDLLTGGNSAQEVRESMPTIPAGDSIGSTINTIGQEGLGFALGAAGGVGVFNTISKGVSNLPRSGSFVRKGAEKAWNYLTRGASSGATATAGNTVRVGGQAIAANAGGSMLVDPEIEGLVFGKGGYWGDIGLTDGGSYSEELANKRLNIMADALVTGAAATGVLTGASAAANFATGTFIAPITRFFSGQSRENAIVQEILSLGSTIPDNATPEQVNEIYRRTANIIQNNREEVIALSDIGGDLTLQRNTLEALENGLRESGSAEDLLAAERVATARRSLNELPDIKRGAAERRENIEGYTDRLYTEGGGAEGVQQTGRSLVEGGRREVGGFSDRANTLRRDADIANMEVEEALRNDPTFGSDLTRMEDAANIDIQRRTNESVEQIVENVRTAEQTLKGQMDTAYEDLSKAIPPNLKFDSGSFDNAYRRVEEFLEPDFQAAVQDQTGDNFRWLFSDGLRSVNRSISRSPVGSPAYKELLEFKRHIQQDQVDMLAQRNLRSAPAVKEAQENAINSARNYYDYFTDGPLARIRDAQRNVITFGDGRVNRSTQAQAQTDSLATVEGAISNAQRPNTQVLRDILGTPEGQESSGLVTDVIIGRAMGDLRAKVQTNGLSEVDVSDFTRGLQEYGTMLRDQDPDAFERIQTTIRNVQQQKNDITTFRTMADEAEARGVEVEKELFGSGGPLNRFVKGNNADSEILDNTQAVFDNMFKNDQTNEIRSVITRAKNDPEALAGIQAAFAKSLDGFSNTTDVIKNKDRILNYSEIIYADKPSVTEANRQIIDMIEKTKVSGTLFSAGNNPVAGINDDFTTAAGRLVTIFLGVLNPTATRARLAAGVIRSNMGGESDLKRLMGAVNGNPNDFNGAFERFMQARATGKPMTDTEKDFIFNFMVKGGLLGTRDRDKFSERFADVEQMLMDADSRQGSTENDETDTILLDEIVVPSNRR